MKRDLSSRVFITLPNAVSLVELDLDGWLQPLLERLQSERVSVEPLAIASVPKGRGLTRPGAWLPLDEHTSYAALVGCCFPAIHRQLGWSQDRIDFAYQLRSPERTNWIRPPFECYERFRARSIALAHKHSHVVFADISAYYENVNRAALLSQLRAAGAPTSALNLLGRMLWGWEQSVGLGLPQGLAPSDVLAKLYLEPVDRMFESEGIVAVRYVDDIRIFCDSEQEAKVELVRLLDRLRERGLQVQSHKTRIEGRDKALAEIDRTAPVIRRINKAYTSEVISAVAPDGDPYMRVFELDALVAAQPDDVSLDIITDELRRHLDEDPAAIDKSVLHYLCRRLAVAGSRYGWRDLLHLLVPRPEETGFLLGHLGRLGLAVEAEPYLVEFLTSADAVYPYQDYEIAEWLAQQLGTPSPALRQWAASRLREPLTPWYLRIALRSILGKGKDATDLDRMEEEHRVGLPLREDVEALCSLQSLERSRRNRLLAQAAERHPLYARTSRLVRSRD